MVLTWREGAPNAVLQDLHALPALLHSPALQQRGSLQQLLNTLPSSSAEGADTFGSGGAGTAGPNSSSNRGSTAMLEPLMVPCRVAGVGVRVERVHRVCGRRVEESSLADFFGEACDDDMDVGAPPPATAAPAAGAAAVPAPPTAEAPPLPLSVRADGLWECAFCGVECAGAETVLEFAGCSLTLAPPQAGDDVRSDSIAAGNPAAADAAASGGGGDADIHHKRPLTELPAVGVQAEARAVEALLGMSAEAYCRLGDGQQRALQARIAAGAANTGDDAPTVAAACVADKQSCAAPCAGVRAVVCCCRCDGNREEVASAAPFAGGCAAGPKEAAEMQQAIAAKSFRVTGLARLL